MPCEVHSSLFLQTQIGLSTLAMAVMSGMEGTALYFCRRQAKKDMFTMPERSILASVCCQKSGPHACSIGRQLRSAVLSACSFVLSHAMPSQSCFGEGLVAGVGV